MVMLWSCDGHVDKNVISSYWGIQKKLQMIGNGALYPSGHVPMH